MPIPPRSSHGRRRGAASALLPAAFAAAVGGSLGAQGRAADDRPTIEPRLIATQQLTERDGLPRVLVYGTARAADGATWVATALGPHRWNGRRFAAEPLPSPYDAIMVRHLLPVGPTMWGATTRGLFRHDGRRWARIVDSPDGRLWRLAAWRPRPGAASIVVAGGDTRLHAFDAATQRPVPLATAGFPATLPMLAVTRVDADELLWVASLRDGVWRLRGAAGATPVWALRAGAAGTVFEDVRACPQLGRDAVVAASDSGAWLLSAAGAPRRLGPVRNVVRVVCAGSADAPEFWIGTRAGAIVRRTAEREQPVALANTSSRLWLQGLDAHAEADGTWTVFFGPAQTGLWRLTSRAIAYVPMGERFAGLPVAAAMEAPAARGPAHLFVSLGGTGLVDLARPTDSTLMLRDVAGAFVRFADSTIAAVGPRVVWFTRDGRWREPRALQGRTLWNATPALRDGRQEMVVALDDGLHVFAWPDGVLRRLPGDPAGPMERLSYDPVGDRLWAGRRDTFFVIALATGRTDTLASRDGLPRGPYTFARLAPLADGRRVVLVGVPGGIAVADAGAARPRFVVHDTTTLPALPAGVLSSAAVLPDGRIVVSSGDGVAVVALGADLEAPPRPLAVYGTEDGLLEAKVDRTTPAIEPGTVWLATTAGLAQLRVPPRTSAAPPPLALAIAVRSAADTAPLTDGATLPWRAASLTATALVDELAHGTRLRFAFRLRGPSAIDTATVWSAVRERRFEGLADGDYVLEVRARDALGTVTPPRTLRFTVLPPPWRAPSTLVLYGLMIAAAAAGTATLRTRRLRDRTREAERAAARIRASEERFRLVFDRGIDAQLLVEHGHVVGANPAALALFGEPRVDLLLGRAIDALVESRADAPGDTDSDAVPATVRAVDGTRIPVTVRRTAIPLDTGTVTHLELRDRREAERLAAEREELEQQLRASQRLESLGTLAGGVAHDFNNLLTVIRMNAELAELAVGDGDTAGAQEGLTAVLGASDRARDIVRQILTFSRRAPATRHPLHLGTLVGDARALLRSTLPTAVQLELDDASGDDGWIAGEATQLQQLLLNLASNAEHAMRRTGGTLRIAVDAVTLDARPARGLRTLAPGDYVRLVVADTGVGMAPQTLARIFEPFFTTKPVGEGTGLGLAVLHGIVESHGGGVHVESEPGRGTRFEIVFPRIAAPAVAPRATAIDTPSRGVPIAVRATQTVVLVDDEPDVLRAAERALRSVGLTVRTAACGEEAITLLHALDGEVDCLVTDQSMPGLQGDALAEYVARTWPHVPVVICTGFAARIGGDVLRRGRITALIEKPYQREQLIAVVVGAIDGERGGVIPS